MDYNKIGSFIAEERKRLGLTQAKLAGKLFVSEKTISKWENGNGLPDTAILKNLCEIFGITINELLNGERISNSDYKNKAESKLIELQEKREFSDKTLLFSEIIIGVLGVIILFSTIGLYFYLCETEYNILGVVVMIIGFILFLGLMAFALLIEQRAGYYVCKKCSHKYVPTYLQVFIAPHINRSRYMKCPHCKKWSYHKKVIK